jgi:hypothetical protein
MRYLLIVLAILASNKNALSDQITIGLDRCVVINTSTHQNGDSKVAVHFDLPRELSEKEIVFAELSFSLPSMRLQADSLLLIRFFPLLAEWTEGDINYDGSGAFTDRVTAGGYSTPHADSNSFNFDLTFYIKDIVDGQRNNFGLVGKANLLGNDIIRLPDNLNSFVRNRARLKIIYR